MAKTSARHARPTASCNDPRSPYFNAEALARDVGIRFKGVEKTNVEEYCVSEGWVRVAAGKAQGSLRQSADHQADRRSRGLFQEQEAGLRRRAMTTTISATRSRSSKRASRRWRVDRALPQDFAGRQARHRRRRDLDRARAAGGDPVFPRHHHRRAGGHDRRHRAAGLERDHLDASRSRLRAAEAMRADLIGRMHCAWSARNADAALSANPSARRRDSGICTKRPPIRRSPCLSPDRPATIHAAIQRGSRKRHPQASRNHVGIRRSEAIGLRSAAKDRFGNPKSS